MFDHCILYIRICYKRINIELKFTEFGRKYVLKNVFLPETFCQSDIGMYIFIYTCIL